MVLVPNWAKIRKINKYFLWLNFRDGNCCKASLDLKQCVFDPFWLPLPSPTPLIRPKFKKTPNIIKFVFLFS